MTGPGSPGPAGAGRHRERASSTPGADARGALLVEDDRQHRRPDPVQPVVRGYDTVVSVDGARALQLLETEEPDIVLLDLMLPEVDGWSCVARSGSARRGVIVVSARGGERDKVTALNMGPTTT